MQSWNKFQSTLPARGATVGGFLHYMHQSISIHAPRTGSDKRTRTRRSSSCTFQSTLPARGATNLYGELVTLVNISIHAPRTGSDTCERRYPIDHNTFQSTLPARGATRRTRPQSCRPRPFQSTLPHGERLRQLPTSSTVGNFNPRSPHGERHVWTVAISVSLGISIHAPRTGSDKAQFRRA